jgi:acid phosphatase family membrane protein YuiD
MYGRDSATMPSLTTSLAVTAGFAVAMFVLASVIAAGQSKADLE